MMQNEVASKYSQALFALGKEEDNLITLQEDLNETWQLLKEQEELKKMLFHQRILPEEKKKVITSLLTEEVSRITLNFLSLLIDKRREYYLEQIINDFNNLVNREQEIIEIKVISAIKLSDELQEGLKNKLMDLLPSKNIKLNNEVRPDILGGLIIKVGDYVVDGSVKRELNLLKERIERIPVSELGVQLDAN